MSVPGQTTVTSSMKVTPQVLCGPVHLNNKHALDWSWLGPVAFGCHKYVVVVDPHTSQNLQTLDGHSTTINRVRWSRQLHHSTLASPYIHRLASVDTNGQCIVWDVGQATHVANFSVGNRPVVDLQWLTTNDNCRDLLVIFTSPSTMTVWNADTGTRISRFTFSETISGFSFNPFHPEQLVLLSPECFVFINEFNPQRNPTGSKKMYMNIPRQQHIGGGGRGWSKEAPRRLLSDDSLRDDDSLTLTDCIQISFSPVVRNHLFLLYPREILIIETDIMQAVGSVFLERVSSPFLQMYPCQQRDAFYCLHENGSISFRVRSPVEFPQSNTLVMSDFREFIDVVYDLHYLTEAQRISKAVKPLSLAVCPTTELNLAVLNTEGKLLLWEMSFEYTGIYGDRTLAGTTSDTEEDSRPLTLISAIPNKTGEEMIFGNEYKSLTLSETIAPHWFTPVDGPYTYSLLSPNMTLTNIYYGLSPSPITLKMCPPLTTKNINFYKPLVAVGNGAGGIQFFNLSSRQLFREITVHTCSVRGIEWINHNKLLSFAYPPPNSSGMVRNELAVIDLETGHVSQLKKGDTAYVQPILSIKVSPHKNYFVVNKKESPPEFYNAKTFTFMRLLEAKPSNFVSLEWANANAFPSFVSKSHSRSTQSDVTENGTVSPQHETRTSSQSPEKEILSLVDINSNVHHIIVDRVGFAIGPQKSQNFALRNPSSMAWKGEYLLVGDSEGTLMMWDMSSTAYKYVETSKALIKKLKFGPGKGNRRLLVLYQNRLEIRDINEDAVLGQFKWSKGEISIDDVDWCSSDKLVCLMSDGTLKVTDVKFFYSSTAYSATDYHETIFNPPTMLPQSTFRFKCLLQHQPWNIEYSLDNSELDIVDPIEKGVSILLETMPIKFKEHLMDVTLGTPQRSLIAAILLGDEHETHFWTVALYHMIKEKCRLNDPQYRRYQYSPSFSNPGSDLFQPDSQASTNITSSLRHSLEELGDDEESSSDQLIQEANQRTWQLTPPLDLCYDLFMDQDIFKHYQLHRVLCHDGRRHTTSQTRHCAETLLFLRQTDRAVQLLLETDTTNNEYYTDALKACLAATIRSSGASQSTIKLVATNLIANNKLSEGSQLLALIDKGLDACRYLQTYGEWYKSVWLAKSTLSERETKEVFTRWAENLSTPSVNQKKKGILVLLSLGQFLKVTETLYSMRYFDLAAVFAESCLEYGLIRKNKDTTSLLEAVFLEYARGLDSMGMKRAMRYYCNLAGEKGKLLLEEHLSPSQGKSLV